MLSQTNCSLPCANASVDHVAFYEIKKKRVRGVRTFIFSQRRERKNLVSF